jgi:hypothetical protein
MGGETGKSCWVYSVKDEDWKALPDLKSYKNGKLGARLCILGKTLIFVSSLQIQKLELDEIEKGWKVSKSSIKQPTLIFPISIDKFFLSDQSEKSNF